MNTTEPTPAPLSLWNPSWFDSAENEIEEWMEREANMSSPERDAAPEPVMRPTTPVFHLRKRQRDELEEGNEKIHDLEDFPQTEHLLRAYHHSEGRWEWEAHCEITFAPNLPWMKYDSN